MNMKLYFVGADHEVTGSCHIIEACGKKIMVDRGMEQGIDIFENADLPFAPADFDAILLTHAHIDHSGLVPVMYAQGYSGEIYATKATCDLCDIMLRDSAHIQEFESEWRNDKAKRQNKEPYVPLYTMQDALVAIEHLIPHEYNTVYELFPGISIRFTDVGHLLGSACIEVMINEDGEERTILFSGDVGNTNQPIIKDPGYVEKADYLVIESTYGDRSHGDRPDYIKALAEIIQTTFDRGGNVVIPSFAVGRTQEMLYFIRQIKQDNIIQGHDDFKVYVDSPLANSATTVFNKHVKDCFDDEALALVEKGVNPISFKGLELAITSDESKAINTLMEPVVILSASGMCDAGRIKHHLKNNLWRKNSTILFVGYQSVGTVGRKLVDGATEVKILGESVNVEADIKVLPGVSGHADKEGLIAWAGKLEAPPKKVFVVHGEDTVCDTFCGLLQSELGYDATAPYSGAVYDLIKNEYEYVTEGVRIDNEKRQFNQIVTGSVSARKTGDRDQTGEPEKTGKGGKTPDPAHSGVKRQEYIDLLATESRLRDLIARNEHLNNKDLRRLKKQLDELISAWE